MRFRSLVAASGNLFVSFRTSFIFDPANEINKNNRLLLLINRALGFEGGNFWPFVLLLVRLALLLTLLL
jgi:hypothetical protein